MPVADANDAKLVALRRDMDRLNDRLFELLEERIRLAGQIAARKRALSLPIHDPGRESDEVAAVQRRVGDLDPAAGERILRVIIEETRKAQGAR